MDELLNPFAPGAGIQPPELTGRSELLRQAEITIRRTTIGRFGKSFVAVGLRGVGKTVVLNRICNIATKYGCKSALLEMHEDKSLPVTLIPEIRKILLEFKQDNGLTKAIKKALGVFKSFLKTIKVTCGDVEVGIDIDPELGFADTNDIELDLPDLFVALGEAAKENNKSVVFVLDEMQYLSEIEMSAVIMALHKTVQKQLPILFVGAGLPMIVGKMGKSKSYAERLFLFPEIGALTFSDACNALNVPANKENTCFSDEALSEIYSLTKGYPYFIQEWGYACWNVAKDTVFTKSDVDAATPFVIEALDRGFFRVRFDRLTRREKQYLRAMAELGEGPYRSSDIANRLGVDIKRLGPMRANLISKGMIFSPSYGDTAFTVPLFDQHIRRVMDFCRWDDSE